MSEPTNPKPTNPKPTKLFTVQIETEIVVAAGDAKEAAEIARRWWFDIRSQEEFDFLAYEMTYMPGGWDDDSLVYGRETSDKTIADWIGLGAAPAYEKHRAKMAELKARVEASGGLNLKGGPKP